jgi:integrase
VAAKVKFDRGAWWVFTHYQGKRKKKRVGPTKANKREADQIAKQINAALALGTFRAGAEDSKPLPCDVELRRWHATYAVTMKPTYRILTSGLIKNHLIPHFGSKDLREIHEADLLDYIRAKMAAGLAPKTIRNGMSVLRRVFTLLERDGLVNRNPASSIGELIRRVDRASATEVKEVQYWTREEVSQLLETARLHEPRFAPVLVVLFSTGMRRGEALGLQWSDVDFDRGRISIRRSITSAGLSTPKSGSGRTVGMTAGLAEALFDLLACRRREQLSRGWPEVPAWLFCSETGSPPDPSNVERAWRRVRRRAQKLGVRSLKLHCARHTWATFALHAGRNIRWVADQLGHSDPALTLRVYAHAMRNEETDLSFAEFGDPKRPYTAPRNETELEEVANYLKTMARRAGLEPATLRFEA